MSQKDNEEIAKLREALEQIISMHVYAMAEIAYRKGVEDAANNIIKEKRMSQKDFEVYDKMDDYDDITIEEITELRKALEEIIRIAEEEDDDPALQVIEVAKEALGR
jgi:hypothetical protein